MTRVPPVVALEIGTSKVAVAVGERQPDGHVLLTGLGREDSKGVRKGEIVDLETALACVKTALARAEESAQVDVESVQLAVSGGHLLSQVNQGAVAITGRTGLITAPDEEAARQMARALHLPPDREVIHSIGQHYIIDGDRVVRRAAGMEGARLALDMLIVHGDRKRLHTPAILVKSIPVTLENLVFGGLCAALGVLNAEQKESGALVLDLGGGTTDYLLYASSKIAAAGTVAVGGDHVTNDIAAAFSVQTRQAERIKREWGSAVVDVANRMRMLTAPAEVGYEARSFSQGALHAVIQARMDELFRLIHRRLREENLHQIQSGVILTGGGAKLSGVRELAQKVFRLPCMVGVPQGLGGAVTPVADPEYAVVTGLVKYGFSTSRGEAAGFWRRMRERLSLFGRMTREADEEDENE